MATNGLKLPRGERVTDGRMVRPDEVPNGLACDCVCPSCRCRLVAKQGEINRPHFAHESEADCSGAIESIIHRLAKQEIADARGAFAIPPLVARYRQQSKVIIAGRDVVLKNVRMEETRGGLRPDILAEFQGRELAIEVFVTHPCDEAKTLRLAEIALPTVEIDLAKYHGRQEIDPSAFRWDVIKQSPRRWVFNPRQAAVDALLREGVQREEAIAAAKVLIAKAVDLARADYDRQWRLLAGLQAHAIWEVEQIPRRIRDIAAAIKREAEKLTEVEKQVAWLVKIEASTAQRKRDVAFILAERSFVNAFWHGDADPLPDVWLS